MYKNLNVQKLLKFNCIYELQLLKFKCFDHILKERKKEKFYEIIEYQNKS